MWLLWLQPKLHLIAQAFRKYDKTSQLYLQALKNVWQGGFQVTPVSGSVAHRGCAVVQDIRGEEEPGYFGGYGRLRQSQSICQNLHDLHIHALCKCYENILDKWDANTSNDSVCMQSQVTDHDALYSPMLESEISKSKIEKNVKVGMSSGNKKQVLRRSANTWLRRQEAAKSCISVGASRCCPVVAC